MKRALLLAPALAVVAVALAALAILWPRRGEPEHVPLASGAGETAPREEPEPPGPVSGAVAEVPGSEREAVEPAPAVAREPEAAAIEPPGGLPVLVVNPEGEPVAGVPVALLGRIDGMGDSEESYASATTGAQGLARLVEEEDSRERRARMKEFLGVELLFRVEAQVLFHDRPEHDLGSELEVAEPIRLVLPPSGGVRVHVATPDGEPLPEWCQVFPFWRPAGSDERFGRIGTPRETAVDGVAAFPIVPLGQEFQFNVGGGKAYRSSQATALGPARAGETVDVEVVLGPPLATVTGVLIGEDGTPLTGVSVSMALFTVERDAPPDAEPDRVPWLWTKLDGEGRFTRATHLEPGGGERFAVRFHEVSRHTPSEVDRFARWDGAVELTPGAVFDLGTLVLRPHGARRLLVAGRVRAEDGGPLRTPRVDVTSWDSEARSWTRLAEDRIEVDGDGFFECHTILEELPERFTVTAGARGFLGASVEASPGDRGFELVLRRGGGLAGRFVTDDRAALPMLAVLIEGEEFRRKPDIGLGHFHVDGLPPGTYSVIAIGHGTDWRYGGVEDVVVPEGGFAEDPRLERIDLGDACRVLRLTVLDPAGEPIPKHHVSIDDRAGDGGSFRTDDDGALVALVPATAAELGLSVSYQGQLLGAVWAASSGYTGTLTLLERSR